MTYNHVSYIEDALNGFCMQKTTFPFICTILDDASIDGEPEVIKRYLHVHFDLENEKVVRKENTGDYYLVFAQHKVNKNCYFAVYFLKYNHYNIKKSKMSYIQNWHNNVKYIAVCEGDDYWIDPEKLQIQVDFLESNPLYSMCFHNAKIKKEDCKDGVFMKKRVEDRDYNGRDIFRYWIVPTCSKLFNKNVLEVETKGNDRILYGDIVLNLKCAYVGLVRGFSKEMAVYRVHSNSLVHNEIYLRNALPRKILHYEFIRDNFRSIISNWDLRFRISDAYFDMFRSNKKMEMRSWYYLMKSIINDPLVILLRLCRFLSKNRQ